MKKKLADHSKTKDILESKYKKMDLTDDPYFGAICLVDIKKVGKKWQVDRKNNSEETILDNGYKWLILLPREEKFSITAIFDQELNFIEFYFDISKKVKYKPKVPYTLDLYLDVVLTKENDVIFLDEDELNEAFKNSNIKKKDYELARKTADKIVNKFHNQQEFENLVEISRNYLEKIIELSNE